MGQLLTDELVEMWKPRWKELIEDMGTTPDSWEIYLANGSTIKLVEPDPETKKLNKTVDDMMMGLTKPGETVLVSDDHLSKLTGWTEEDDTTWEGYATEEMDKDRAEIERAELLATKSLCQLVCRRPTMLQWYEDSDLLYMVKECERYLSKLYYNRVEQALWLFKAEIYRREEEIARREQFKLEDWVDGRVGALTDEVVSEMPDLWEQYKARVKTEDKQRDMLERDRKGYAAEPTPVVESKPVPKKDTRPPCNIIPNTAKASTQRQPLSAEVVDRLVKMQVPDECGRLGLQSPAQVR